MQTAAAEKTLTDLGIAFIHVTGGLRVEGDIDLEGRDLTQLPDLSCVFVSGNFLCGDNNLTSLVGAPREVDGYFGCARNMLTTLEGAPRRVGGTFFCFNNELTSLNGAPEYICEKLDCRMNPLASLEGLSHFKQVISDLGTFTRPQDIPHDIRLSPETRARQQAEEAEKLSRQIKDCAQAAVTLDKDTVIRAPKIRLPAKKVP